MRGFFKSQSLAGSAYFHSRVQCCVQGELDEWLPLGHQCIGMWSQRRGAEKLTCVGQGGCVCCTHTWRCDLCGKGECVGCTHTEKGPSELERFGKDECCLPVRAPGPNTTSPQPTTPSLCMLTRLMWALLFLQSECSACIFSLFDLSFSSSWCFPIGSWGCWKHHELWDPWDYTVPWRLCQKEVND